MYVSKLADEKNIFAWLNYVQEYIHY